MTYTDLLTEINRIKESEGLTNKLISERSGIDPAHISKYLNGKKMMQADTLTRVVSALGKKLDIS